MYGSGEIAEVFQACAQLGFYNQLFQLHSRTAQYGELSRKDSILRLLALRDLDASPELRAHILPARDPALLDRYLKNAPGQLNHLVHERSAGPGSVLIADR